MLSPVMFAAHNETSSCGEHVASEIDLVLSRETPSRAERDAR